MFSLSYISPQILTYHNQPPYHVDVRPTSFTKYSHKRNRCNRNYLNFPKREDLPFLAHCFPVSASVVDVGDCDDIQLLNSTNPITWHGYCASTAGRWLQSCSCVEGVRKVHAFVIKFMGHPGMFVNNNLISGYAKVGHLVYAHKVFDNMSERSVVSWTAMLNGYQKHGLGGEALRLFGEFVKSGFRWNAQTYVCVLNLSIEMSDYELGRQLHACVVKHQVSNFILDSSILHFYAKSGDLDSAIDVFERMRKRDLVAWTTMITACSQHNRGQEAFVMMSEMLGNGLDPNEFTVCSVLNACGSEKELRLGKQLHAIVVKKSYDVDVYVGTSLVDMYAKCGKIEDSTALFSGMGTKNVITWTSIIAGYTRNGLAEEALRFFREMKILKVSANDLTIVSILRACGLLRGLSTGKEVHAQILKSSSPINVMVGSEIVWFYCQCKEFISAYRVLQSLPEKDVVSWTAMISGCSELHHEYEALVYLKQMLGEGVEPNHFTYSSVLKACAKLENVKQGKLLHSSINKSAAAHNVFVGSALVHMYSQCGYLSDAVQVFDTMPEKNIVSWRAMILAYTKNSLCGEALKLMHRMQAEGIEADDHIQSTVLTSCENFRWGKEPSSDQCLLTCCPEKTIEQSNIIEIGG